MSKNEITAYQNSWDAAKAMFRGKFLAVNACIEKEGRSQIKHLTSYWKKLEEEEQIIFKAGRRKAIIKLEWK